MSHKIRTAQERQGNIIPAATKEFAQLEFKRAAKANDGDTVTKFLAAVDSLMACKRSFCLSDICYYAQPYNLDPIKTRQLFQTWCAVMERLHKITVIDGCYSEPLVCLV